MQTVVSTIRNHRSSVYARAWSLLLLVPTLAACTASYVDDPPPSVAEAPPEYGEPEPPPGAVPPDAEPTRPPTPPPNTPPPPPSPPAAAASVPAPSTEAPPPAPADTQHVYTPTEPSGQWVYASPEGWVWMPYERAYTYVTPAEDDAYAYVYYPARGWLWIRAPWVLGIGPRPYWGRWGPARFAWYGRPWFHPHRAYYYRHPHYRSRRVYRR